MYNNDWLDLFLFLILWDFIVGHKPDGYYAVKSGNILMT